MPANTTANRRQEQTEPTARRWLSQVRAFAERSLREVGNARLQLLSVLVVPAMMYLSTTMTGGDQPPGLAGSLAVGVGVMGAMFVCLYLFGDLLVADVEDRRHAAYRTMPVSPAAELAGRMTAGLVLAAGAFAFTLAVAALAGAGFGFQSILSPLVVVVAGVLNCVFWMVVAVPLVVYADNEQVAEWTTTLVAVVAFSVTGFNGALPALSPLSGDVLNYLPNTLPTRLLVYHLVPGGEWEAAGVAPPALPAGPEYLLLLAGYAVVAVAAGTLVVDRALYGGRWLA